MKNSIARSSENPPVENLSFSFGNLCMRTSKVQNNGAASPLGNNSSVLPPNDSLTTPQQVEIATETSIKNPMPTPIPLYSNNIWAFNSSSDAGDTTMAANTGFVGPSISNNTYWGVNAASGTQGVRGCMLNSNNNLNLNLYGGIASQKSSVVPQYELFAGNGFRYGTGYFGGFSSKKNLNIDGFCAEDFFESLKGNEFMVLAMDQIGSEYLQKQLSKGGPEVTQKILEGVLDCIFVLTTDQYGHHLFGKLIESCSDFQLKQIVAKMTLSSEALQLFIYATNHKDGSKSIKKLIRVLKKSPLIFYVMFLLSKKFDEIMIDQVGSNVVLKCLDILDNRKSEILYKAAIKHCLVLVTHQHGCIALKKFINNMKGRYRDQILNLISENAVFLSQDPCGNYVLQHVLDLHNPIFTEKICYMLKGFYVRLSGQKTGSHVVEACLNSAGVNHVIEDFLTSNQILHVARDQFGNYVIQKALEVTKVTNSPFHQMLLKTLEPHHMSLKHSYYGRNVFSLITSSGVSVDNA